MRALCPRGLSAIAECFVVCTDTTVLCAGNDYINLLTSNARQKLRVDLGDFEGNTAYAEYDNFQVGTEEDQYKLWSVGKYNGTAGQTTTVVLALRR